MKDVVSCYFRFLKQTLKFWGRTSVEEFTTIRLIQLGLLVFWLMVFFIMLPIKAIDEFNFVWAGAGLVVIAVLFIPEFALYVRRFRDVGLNWLGILVVYLVGIAWLAGVVLLPIGLKFKVILALVLLILVIALSFSRQNAFSSLPLVGQHKAKH